MTFIGQQPSTTFDSGIQDRFVQDSSTYSVGGAGNKTLTLGGTLSSGDVVTVYYTNKVMQSVNPTANSVGITELNLSDGSNGQVLQTNGSGTLSFSSNLTFTGGILTAQTDANEQDAILIKQSDGTDVGSLRINNGSFLLKGKNASSPVQMQSHDGNEDIEVDPDGFIKFETSGAERMRIISGGNVGIADTTPSAALEVSPTSSEGVIYATGNSQSNELIRWNNTNDTSTNHTISFFKRNGTTTGSIAHTNNSTSFNTSSDYRLKENQVTLSNGITRLKTLKPYRFNFKTDADKTVDGFFAHEVSSVVPEAITGDKDAVDSEGNVEPQAIDQAKLVPLLTKALQEAITKIETLETEMTSLKARVKTLEDA